jgi:NADP-dependent 3-hydroxy acid dehydrogenase YdfG
MPTIALVAAGTRLGLSLGRVFGGHGFDVALIARSGERLGELTGKLAAEGVTAAGFPADVTDRSALTSALDSAAKRFGGIDVLHYSAPYVRIGDGAMTGVLDVTVENLRPQVEGTCYGAITATRAVLPAMLAAGTGTVLYTTGASAVTPTPWAASIGAAGAALRNWALNLNGALAVSHSAHGSWAPPAYPRMRHRGNRTTSLRSIGTCTPPATPPNASSPHDRTAAPARTRCYGHFHAESAGAKT